MKQFIVFDNPVNQQNIEKIKHFIILLLFVKTFFVVEQSVHLVQ